MAKLTALSAKTLSKPGRHGDGLYLNIAPSGSKSWVQRIVIHGRRRDIGLGPYPAVSLARAREIARDNRSAVAQGRDPVAEKREAREAGLRRAPSIPTFAEAAARVIELRRPTWSNARHASQWENTLAAYAHPVIGNKTVDSITPADAMAVLTPIWTTKPETASRVRQRMETVMDWAITHGYRLDNPAGHSLLKVLPPVKRLKEHRQALPYAQVPGAVALVRECTADIPTKLAFEFLVLTAGRSVEVRAAEWTEIDREAAAWEVLAARMKARRPHRVPLAREGHGDTEGGVTLRRRSRPGIPLRPQRQRGVPHDVHRAAPAAGHSRRPPRIPLQLSGLGDRADVHAVGGGRGSPGPQRGQLHGGGLHAVRPVRPAPGADGRLGGIRQQRVQQGAGPWLNRPDGSGGNRWMTRHWTGSLTRY